MTILKISPVTSTSLLKPIQTALSTSSPNSLGGIIVRQAVNLPGCPKQALLGKAVFLAPPNQGSSFGRYLRRYKSVKKMLGHYAGHKLMIMKSFERIGPMPPTMKVMVIAGDLGLNHSIPEKKDGKVAVEETKLSTPHKHRVIHARSLLD